MEVIVISGEGEPYEKTTRARCHRRRGHCHPAASYDLLLIGPAIRAFDESHPELRNDARERL